MQYFWESAFGSCAVPVVVGVHALADGFVRCGLVYWHDEPDDPFFLPCLHQFIVSCRPGQGTRPTEGDIERWARWSRRARYPSDWWGPDDREDEERIAIRERWVETKRQNQAFRGI